MPIPCHLSLEGEKQGKIEGSCDMVGREGTILAYSMAHNISIPHSPTDGLATGKRIHRPLCVLKEFDRSSPKLYQALCTGEQLKSVVLKWYRITKKGTEEHYFTHKLEDAIVVAIQPYMPITLLEANEPSCHMEEIAFTYKAIRWTWEADGIEAEDSWAVPR
ncbi:MAG: Hcp family type VI secretion system effector [Geobacteraceae bacterium]|nr:Hcp family type VI secretion system effector [Geobacteraceae bacterium]